MAVKSLGSCCQKMEQMEQKKHFLWTKGEHERLVMHMNLCMVLFVGVVLAGA